MTFFGEEGQQNERALTFEKSRDKRHIACPDVVPLTGLEPVRCCQRGIFMPHYVAIAARSKRCGLDFIFAIDPRP